MPNLSQCHSTSRTSRKRRKQDRAILSSSERRRVNCRRRMMIYRFKGEEK